MARFDLTDCEWSVIQPLLPNKSRGVARVDDRRVLRLQAETTPLHRNPIQAVVTITIKSFGSDNCL